MTSEKMQKESFKCEKCIFLDVSIQLAKLRVYLAGKSFHIIVGKQELHGPGNE